MHDKDKAQIIVADGGEIMRLYDGKYAFQWEGTPGGRGNQYIEISIHGKVEDVINTETADPGPFGDSMQRFTMDVFLAEVNQWRFGE